MNTQDRLIKRSKELGLKQVDIVKATKASKGTVSNWFAGRDAPSSKYLVPLSNILRTSPDWLLYGKDKPRKNYTSEVGKDQDEMIIEIKNNNTEEDIDGALKAMDFWDSSTPLNSDEVEVPFFMDVELAAGIGGELANENRGPKLRFAKSTLRRCGVQPEAAACVKVSGNSMEPRLYDGDVVGVDTLDKRIVDGKTYAINHDGLLRVKRLYRLPGGGIRINSMNTLEYPDEHYDAEDAKHITVIGRVFWHSSIW
jgi:phage repressor protein C with HTH and peptisase S24 domain